MRDKNRPFLRAHLKHNKARNMLTADLRYLRKNGKSRLNEALFMWALSIFEMSIRDLMKNLT
jgi:hypothetical protein